MNIGLRLLTKLGLTSQDATAFLVLDTVEETGRIHVFLRPPVWFWMVDMPKDFEGFDVVAHRIGIAPPSPRNGDVA